jgi:DNA-binding Lrp family transcriptional regulator
MRQVGIGGRGTAVRALILVRARRGRAERVARRLERIEGVTKAFVVFGEADVVARAEVPGLAELAQVVRRVGRTWGVASSETLPEWEVA